MIHIVKYGLTGSQSVSAPYNGIMPAWGSTLSNDISRRSRLHSLGWGNAAGTVTQADVAGVKP